MSLASLTNGRFSTTRTIFYTHTRTSTSTLATNSRTVRSLCRPPPLPASLFVSRCCRRHSRPSSDPSMGSTADGTGGVRGPITHVVFDMDGLLLDTEPFYTLVQEKILERFGKTFDWSLKAKMMGKKAIESARIFVEESGLEGLMTPEGFLQEREGMLLELFPTCTAMPGVKRLVHHLHASRIPMAVATGSYQRHFELKTQNHSEIFSMMHHVVTGDDPDVKKGKPSPDVFLAAAKRFEGPVEPNKVLVFEDAPSGVAAAKNAGMHVVMVPDPKLDVSYHKEADQVLGSLLDFNPSEWGLPPFKAFDN